MNRGRVSTQVLLSFFMMMLLMVIGCSSAQDAVQDIVDQYTTYNITGTVTLSGSNTPLSGVTINLSGTAIDSTVTGTDGSYQFKDKKIGVYTVTPVLNGYTFSPASADVNLASADVTVPTFVATAITTGAFTQADLTGTWRMNNLRNDKWMRAQISINSSGVATCNSMSDSGGGTTCPSPFDLTLTMNPSTGVITQTGANAANAGTDHMTMTSTKNLMVGTATNGSSGSYKYQLVIVQKDEGTSPSYSSGDVQSKSFVYHRLKVGSSNDWQYGAGTSDGSGVITITSQTDPSSGTTTPGVTSMTMSVDSNGIVTVSGSATTQGFLSADKKTIVLTETGGSRNDNYRLQIIQITATEFTAGALPAGIAVGHMLGAGTGFAGWVHFTNTVAPGGTMTYSDWADSFRGSAPSGTYTGSITASGTLTIAGNPTYHGQVSHDGKFTVGTHTSNGSYYFLNVTTE